MFSIMKPEGGQRKETLLRMKNGSNFDFESRLADRMSMFSEQLTGKPELEKLIASSGDLEAGTQAFTAQ